MHRDRVLHDVRACCDMRPVLWVYTVEISHIHIHVLSRLRRDDDDDARWARMSVHVHDEHGWQDGRQTAGLS